MSATYSYTQTPIIADKLEQEIQISSISTGILELIEDVEGGAPNLFITFDSTLSAGDETVLDGIVAAHDGTTQLPEDIPQWELDALSILDYTILIPPGSPAIGDKYFINGIGTGDWTGHNQELTEWDGVQWLFFVLPPGTTVFDTNSNQQLVVGNGGFLSVNHVSRTRNPNETDDFANGYTVGTLWLNTVFNRTFVCVDSTTNFAIWVPTTSDIILMRVRNVTGSSISSNKLVYITGVDGTYNIPTIALADKDDTSKTPAVGITETTIGNGVNEFILVKGRLQNVNTSAFSLNDKLTLGTNGGFVLPPIVNPNFTGVIQEIGSVDKVHVTTGEILINIALDLSILDAAHVYYINDTGYTGYVSGGMVTRGGGLTVDVTAGYGYIEIGGILNRVNWSATSGITLTANRTNFIYVNSSNNVVSSIVDPDDQDVVSLAVARTDSSNVILLTTQNISLVQRPAQFHQYVQEVVGPITAFGVTGQIFGGGPSLQFEVDSGAFYIQNSRKIVPATSPATFTYWYQNGSGGYNFVTGQTALDPNFYDDGSGTLAALPVGKYKKDLLYVAQNDTAPEYHVFYGQEFFNVQQDAVVGNLPIAENSSIGTYALRSTGFVILKGSATIAVVVDVRPFLGQLAPSISTITLHSQLGGLTSDDHTQYLLVNGTRAMSGDLDMGGNDIINVGDVDGVDISNHASRHLPSGADPITTAAPITDLSATTSNSVGSANSLARSDHEHMIDTGVVSTQTPDQANAVGTSASLARADHIHNIVTATAVSIGSSNSQGSSTSFSRADHVHQGVHSVNANGGSQEFNDLTLTNGDNITIIDSSGNFTINDYAGKNTVSTTNNTTTTITTIATTSNIAYIVEFFVVGRRTGGPAGTAGDGASYKRIARVKNVSGTVTIPTIQTDFTSEDQGGWDATISVSGTNVIITVKGATNNNIDWTSTYRIYQV